MTELSIIDEDLAIELLEKAVKLRGENYAYPLSEDGSACKYVLNGEPGCIVGLSLFIHGVPIEVLASADVTTFLSIKSNPILWEYLTSTGRKVMEDAQSSQDGGEYWGNVLAYARRKLAQRKYS